MALVCVLLRRPSRLVSEFPPRSPFRCLSPFSGNKAVQSVQQITAKREDERGEYTQAL